MLMVRTEHCLCRLRRNRARSGYAGDVDVDAALGEGVPSSAKAGPKRAGERLSSDRHQASAQYRTDQQQLKTNLGFRCWPGAALLQPSDSD